VTDFLNGAQPEVWVADRYAGQLGHGAARQMCLAHYADPRIMPPDGWEPAPMAVIAALGPA